MNLRHEKRAGTTSSPWFADPIGRLRTIGLIEGVSFLVLLGVAMPLKYLADMPMAVKIVGWAHGVLFIALCCALAAVKLERRWPVWKAAKVLIAALLPFGPFVIDRSLKAEQSASR